MFVILVLIAISTVVLSYYVRRYMRALDMVKNIPGPPPLPLLGNAMTFNGKPHDIFLTLKKLWETYGPIYKLYFANDLTIVISGAKEVESLLSSPKLIDKANDYKFLHSWLGTGLLLSTGRKWHSRRKVITPTFHFKILEQYVSVFDEQSAVMVKQLQKFAENGEIFDIFPHVSLCALDIICETAMGTKINAQLREDSEYVKAVKSTCLVLHKRMFSPWKRFSLLYPFSQDFWDHRKALGILHGHTKSVIRTRKRLLEQRQSEDQEQEQDDVGSKKKMAFLDLLLNSTIDGEPLSEESIQEEVDTFMFEGHDTTTSGIAFALYNLAENPEVQEKLFQEMKEIFGDDKDRPATYRELQEMKYMDLVIKESVRTHPPVPIIGRQIFEDSEINGCKLPAYSNISILIYFMNHDPKLWENPEKFIPERFTTENVIEQNKNPYAYVPFSAGPRNCIGQKFAVLEMKSTISKMIRNYELISVQHKVELSVEIVLRSMNGVKIKLAPRKY